MLIVKLSILVQYLTIFVPTRWSRFYIAVHVLMSINILYYVISMFVYIFEVRPRNTFTIKSLFYSLRTD